LSKPITLLHSFLFFQIHKRFHPTNISGHSLNLPEKEKKPDLCYCFSLLLLRSLQSSSLPLFVSRFEPWKSTGSASLSKRLLLDFLMVKIVEFLCVEVDVWLSCSNWCLRWICKRMLEECRRRERGGEKSRRREFGFFTTSFTLVTLF